MSLYARLWLNLPKELRSYLEKVGLTAASALAAFVRDVGDDDTAFAILSVDGGFAVDLSADFAVLVAAAVTEGRREMDRVSAATPADIIVQVEGQGGLAFATPFLRSRSPRRLSRRAPGLRRGAVWSPPSRTPGRTLRASRGRPPWKTPLRSSPRRVSPWPP